MKSIFKTFKHQLIALVAVPLCLFAGLSSAAILGETGTPGVGTREFNLRTGTGNVSTGDGDSVPSWGYATATSPLTMQYPGPTLFVNQGEVVTINLTNNLPVTSSIVFPGQTGVVATGGTPGLLTNEAAPSGGTVSYTFTATHPGTFMYHSGTRPDLQVAMGLTGALIVRPTGYDSATNKIAYDNTPSVDANGVNSDYVYEYLFLLSEMDPNLNIVVDDLAHGIGGTLNDASMATIDTTNYKPVLWFINGRTGPDTMEEPGAVLTLANQPYNCLPRTRPGEKLLLRLVGAGRDLHPFHTHGNNAWVIGQDGRFLTTDGVNGADLAHSEYTIKVVPGSTYDAVFDWTGHGLGWDIYGHAAGDPMEPGEDPADHGKALPTILPELQNLVFGGFWSGSPFLGTDAALPPGEGGLNPNFGFVYMWHSHTERELTNNDIFPGGMMTMLIVEAPGVFIE